jgi:pyruvate/2-oxoglutarate dehydrogenase complex dihydrolipoamide dehydrogenase (E3) component
VTAYDLVVLGGGTAGLTAAVGAAQQGARTLLVERARMGGDCLWRGCVPPKALLIVAERAHGARSAAALGRRLNVTGLGSMRPASSSTSAVRWPSTFGCGPATRGSTRAAR